MWDDLKIPFGLNGSSQRYHDANGVLEYDKNIHTVVGHSLGGAVALQLQKDQPNRNLKTRTYGAPVMSFTGGDRYRNVADPVSIFDFGAKTNYNIFDLGLGIPHDYKNLGRDKFSNEKEIDIKEY
jgi:pimeloyl-ACP methyl ester carboxylesterase